MGARSFSGYSAALATKGCWVRILLAALRLGTLAILFTQLCQCLSAETLKAVGPFYLVGNKIPHTEGKCVTSRGLGNSEMNHYCVSPRRGCLEYTDYRHIIQICSMRFVRYVTCHFVFASTVYLMVYDFISYHPTMISKRLSNSF